MTKKIISKNGIKLLAKYEKLMLYPYDDQAPKIRLVEWNERATIGYGHLILKSEWEQFKDGITKEQAIELKQKDLKRFVARINKDIDVMQNQNQFDALVILSYNIGEDGFHNSTVRKMINDPEYISRQYSSLEFAWKAWNKDRDKKTGKKEVSNGLVKRRAKEWKLYNKKQGIFCNEY
jgi:type VI secretion system secreted protein VgrG